jgi:hypothetical protein
MARGCRRRWGLWQPGSVRRMLRSRHVTGIRVTEFAQQLNRELPQDDDIATAMIKIRVITSIVRDLNGEPDE